MKKLTSSQSDKIIDFQDETDEYVGLQIDMLHPDIDDLVELSKGKYIVYEHDDPEIVLFYTEADLRKMKVMSQYELQQLKRLGK